MCVLIVSWETPRWQATILFDRPPDTLLNEIVLSHEFFNEIMSYPIPTDMEAAKALPCSPAALDLFM